MSWGERSCSGCPEGYKGCTMETCNVDCKHYKSNGRQPDSESFIDHFIPEKDKVIAHYKAGSCKVCGKTLHANNPQQVVLYCNRVCRRLRHNKKSK